MSVQFGIDVLIDQHLDLLRGRPAGLISNASGVTNDLVNDVDALLCEPGVQLIALFGPEHGFNSAAADGAPVDSGVDVHTALPVFSLYGDMLRPTDEALEGLEVLIFDIQTVGVRFYTYVTTLMYTMQAAVEHGLSYIVCDRPNPIGGEIVEGPMLEPGYESLVGPGPLPIRHGLTIGELAQLFNEAWGMGCDLTVVPCAGWKRKLWFDETHLPWMPPSPTMPWPETAIVYPGSCLVEGTNLSVGRGTALPFHLVGAPWIDGRLLAEELNQFDISGVHFHRAIFRPAADKWAGELCGGVQLHVTDRNVFRPVTASLHLLQTLRMLYPDELEYRTSGQDSDRLHIDLLLGTDKVRRGMHDGRSVSELVESWTASLSAFKDASSQFQLYN